MSAEKENLIINHLIHRTLKKGYEDGLFSEGDVDDFIDSSTSNPAHLAELAYQTFDIEGLEILERQLVRFLSRNKEVRTNTLELINTIVLNEGADNRGGSAYELYMAASARLIKKNNLSFIRLDISVFNKNVSHFFMGDSPSIEHDHLCDFIKEDLNPSEIAIILDDLSQEQELSELVVKMRKCIPNEKLNKTLEELNRRQEDEKGI